MCFSWFFFRIADCDSSYFVWFVWFAVMIPDFGQTGMQEPTRFNESQLQSIRESLRQAEACLERFYCFSPREWFHFSYELLTAKDLPEELPARPPKVFGEILKKSEHPPGTAASSDPAAVYGIILFDANILRHLRETPGVSFERLTLYILTHELVHLARFFHLIDYDLPDSERIQEEQKVHRLTGLILSQLGDPALTALTEAYLSGEYSL